MAETRKKSTTKAPKAAKELAESIQGRERELEQKAFQAEVYLEKFKQASHFVLALVAGVFGGMLLLQGNELVGLIIILADAAVMVGATKLSVER